MCSLCVWRVSRDALVAVQGDRLAFCNRHTHSWHSVCSCLLSWKELQNRITQSAQGRTMFFNYRCRRPMFTFFVSLFVSCSACLDISFHRYLESWGDPVHAGVWTASLPGGQRQRDPYHDHGLQIHCAHSCLQRLQRVSRTHTHTHARTHTHTHTQHGHAHIASFTFGIHCPNQFHIVMSSNMSNHAWLFQPHNVSMLLCGVS